MDFYFCNVLGDDVFVVADALDPDQLVFLFHVGLEVGVDHFAAFNCCVGAVQNGHFVLWNVNKLN